MISQNQIIGNYTIFPNELLGGGCFGEIYVGCETEKPQNKVAIKHIKLTKFSAKDYTNYIENEKKIYEMISHPNIIKFYDSVSLDNNLYLVLEHCSQSLSSFASKFPNSCIPETQAVSFIHDIAKALAYLNSKKIIHRNLYPNNVLLNEGTIKICSFVFAKIAENLEEIPHMDGGVGIPLYEAPEMYFKDTFSYKVDVWSVGIIFYQMLYGRIPWKPKEGVKKMFEAISKHELELEFPEEPPVTDSIKKLLQEMLNVDQAKRCDWNKVLEATASLED